MGEREYLDGRVRLFPGDCREVLKLLPDNSIDAVVTDPPYALVSITKRFGSEDAAPATPKEGAAGAYARASAGFMGQQWDTGETAFAAEFWREVLRVLKPGGHVVAFSGTRTYHRIASAIEDAGFEVRDQLAWVYGTGFPKSHNVGKAIDKHLGAKREKIRKEGAPAYQRGIGNTRPWMDDPDHMVDGDTPVTPEAEEWEGWGTALKPAWEPICLARKPLAESSIAANILKWAVGAINIRACRIAAEKLTGWGGNASGGRTWTDENSGLCKDGEARPVEGRYPANLITDGSPEVLSAFPDAPGQQRATGPEYGPKRSINVYSDFGPRDEFAPRGDAGSAARFFYSAKADADDRANSTHPTVKPVDLMRWLVRLTCPKGGVVLDPFAGTGPTGAAAFWEGSNAILIEREEKYCADIAERMSLVLAGPEERKRARTEPAAVEELPLFNSAGEGEGGSEIELMGGVTP